MNIKLFNLISRTNKTRYVSWHDTFGCKCRLCASVCNNNVGIMINADVNVTN